ncbi:hypothetical protein J4Q44_G00375240 [Coregonus suidteri]|uniref:C2H2-type domain-containing protein n=1 Tax=Coregonus suidteri TaxID=861788 RepID=A0AAN8Q4U1_9TELE
MYKLEAFRVFLDERLTAAAVEIFGAVEKTVVEYQEENDRLRIMLRITPEIKLCRIDSLQLSLSEEEVPPEQQHCEQEWSPSLGQEDPEPTQIKEEQEELRTSQEEEHLQGLFDTKDSIFTPSCVKSECDLEDPLQEAILAEYPTLSPLKTSKLQSFRVFLNERLTAFAAVEIFGAVEKTVVEYQEENDRLRRLLRITPEIKLCRIDSLQLSLSVSEEEVPPEQQHCEQEWSPSLGQEDPEPTQIKEEQEELRTSQEEEQLQGLEADIIEFKFTPPCVKSECDQEDPLWSLTVPQTQTVENRESDSKPVDFKPFGTVTHLKGLDISCDPPDNQNNASNHSSALLRVFLNERLTAAAVEIFGAVEKTVVEYQEENDQLRRLLRITPEIRLCRIDSLQRSVSVSEEEVPPEQQHCEQEWSPSLGQEDPEPTHIKEEQEELRTSQEEEQLQGLEADTIEFIFTPSCVKSECDQEDPLQSLTLPQTQTVENRESDSKPVDLKPFGTVTHLKCLDIPCDLPYNENNASRLSSAVSSDPVGLDSSTPLEHCSKPSTTSRKNPCHDCGETFPLKADLQRHVTLTKKSLSECRFCNKQYNSTCKLQAHIQLCHMEKSCTCPVCGKTIKHKGDLSRHMSIHTGEKRFSCDSLQLSLSVSEEEVPPEQQHCEQEWSPSLGQEDPEPTQIKEEQEELRTSQEEEQIQGLFDTNDSIFTPSCVKRAQSLWCRQVVREGIPEAGGGRADSPITQGAELGLGGAGAGGVKEGEQFFEIRKDSLQLSLTVSEEEVPPEQQHCEQEWSPSLGQEDPEPTLIKKEHEELRTSQKEEQLQVWRLIS